MKSDKKKFGQINEFKLYQLRVLRNDCRNVKEAVTVSRTYFHFGK